MTPAYTTCRHSSDTTSASFQRELLVFDIVFGATLWIAAGLALAIDAPRMHAVEMKPGMQMAAARQ